MATEALKSNNNLFEVLKEIKDQNAKIAQQNSSIQSDITEIKSELEKQNISVLELQQKITVLETENATLKEKLERIEQEGKKNNIILFGLQEEENDQQNLRKNIIKFCVDRLEVSIAEEDLNDVYRLGKPNSRSRGVLIKLVRAHIKQEILKNARKLKNTGFSLTNDLIPELRQQQKILVKHLKEAKSKNYSAKIVKNKLVVNGEEYTIEQLENSSQSGEKPQPKLNQTLRPTSEPTSPEVFEFPEEIINVPQQPPFAGTRNRTNSIKNKQSELPKLPP
ncbi:unnamed protein product [Ceutorhynchus assimilis]|uniref:Uncharacterized protein n=1 Tax=Ceutorhynchus assimilis TaxID=467358 RepID=A0A9N9MYT2_9CUCU|nr:unnamed protein product [Ceutorhynchus assimilis]